MTTVHSNHVKYLSALAHIEEVSAKLSSGLREDLENRRVRLLKHTAVVRKNATNASSTYPFIDENTKKLAGISSLNGNTLPSNMAVVADAISVGFAEGDGENKEGAVVYTQDVPAALRNANFVMKQNGREIIDIPVADLVKGEMPNKQEDYFHDLEQFILLSDEGSMSWDFVFPGGQNLAPSEAGKNVYIEVRIKGYKTLRNVL